MYVQFLVEKGGIAPQRAKGDAGYDFFVPEDFEATKLGPNDEVLINSHIRSNLPEDIALIAFNKSGVATKKHLQVGACVVDPSYQGEIHLHVYNRSDYVAEIKPGDKLVQFVPVVFDAHEALVYSALKVSMQEFYANKESKRGAGGFGSTGDTYKPEGSGCGC